MKNLCDLIILWKTFHELTKFILNYLFWIEIEKMRPYLTKMIYFNLKMENFFCKKPLNFNAKQIIQNKFH